jgi:signal recognition particle subunit SRP54
MMEELAQIAKATSPAEILLVVDAMTGQEAVRVAETFLEHLPLTALVLTKMDGDARGGAALSIRSVTGLPVAYVGTGEAVDAFEVFHPDRLAQRILGMGDIVTLVERAEERIDREHAEQAAQRLIENRFTLEDFRDQLQQVKKMGPIGQLLEMVPGGAGLAGAAQQAVDEGELKRVEAIIDSMTPVERREPHLIKGSRRKRIAAGSGTSVSDVNRLLRQFEEMQRLMRQLGSSAKGGRAGSLPRLPGR